MTDKIREEFEEWACKNMPDESWFDLFEAYKAGRESMHKDVMEEMQTVRPYDGVNLIDRVKALK